MSTKPLQPPPPPPIRSRKTKTSGRKHAVQRRKKPSRHGANYPVRRELSAGGVAVRQERGQWLVALLKTAHKRGEVWVLPKGHVELAANENISAAARREVQEEAGIQDLSVRDQLGVTRFTFQAEKTVVRKTVHYFLMVTTQKELQPQEEEGLIDAAWFPIDVAIGQLGYEADQDIVRRAKEKLEGKPRQSTPHRAPGRKVRVYT